VLTPGERSDQFLQKHLLKSENIEKKKRREQKKSGEGGRRREEEEEERWRL